MYLSRLGFVVLLPFVPAYNSTRLLSRIDLFRLSDKMLVLNNHENTSIIKRCHAAYLQICCGWQFLEKVNSKSIWNGEKGQEMPHMGFHMSSECDLSPFHWGEMYTFMLKPKHVNSWYLGKIYIYVTVCTEW